MKKKSFLAFIPGNLNYFSYKNLLGLKKNINSELNFFLFPWEDTKQTKINHIKKIYKPIFLKKIYKPNYKNIVKKIKYPDYAGNSIGTLYMWESIRQSFLQINNFYKDKKKPDYVIRYRYDILSKYNFKLIKENLKKNEIIVPDRYHWNGLNDQIFITRFSDIVLFFDIDKFIKKFIKDDRFFCSEFLFQQFLKYKKIKVKYSNFDYSLMRPKGFNKINNNVKSEMKFFDKLNCKFNKLNYRLRNFNNHYIKKKYTNKNQEKIVKLNF